MKITSFNPIYGTEDLDGAEAFFGKMGFKVIHRFSKDGFEVRTLDYPVAMAGRALTADRGKRD